MLLPVFNNSTAVQLYNCATVLPCTCYMVLVGEGFQVDWSSFSTWVFLIEPWVDSGSCFCFDSFQHCIVLVLICTLGLEYLLFILSYSVQAATGNWSCLYKVVFWTFFFMSVLHFICLTFQCHDTTLMFLVCSARRYQGNMCGLLISS